MSLLTVSYYCSLDSISFISGILINYIDVLFSVLHCFYFKFTCLRFALCPIVSTPNSQRSLFKSETLKNLLEVCVCITILTEGGYRLKNLTELRSVREIIFAFYSPNETSII